MKRTERTGVMNNKDKSCKILSLQLKEIHKHTYSGFSVEAAITLMEMFQTQGSPNGYSSAIAKNVEQSPPTVSRQLDMLKKHGLITCDVKFRNNLRKYIELTDKGEYLLARIKRLYSLNSKQPEGCR